MPNPSLSHYETCGICHAAVCEHTLHAGMASLPAAEPSMGTVTGTIPVHTLPYGWPWYPNVCPGCGRCKDCGHPFAAPPPPPPWVWPPSPLGQPIWMINPMDVQCGDLPGTTYTITGTLASLSYG